jgi:hypothetical protein
MIQRNPHSRDGKIESSALVRAWIPDDSQPSNPRCAITVPSLCGLDLASREPAARARHRHHHIHFILNVRIENNFFSVVLNGISRCNDAVHFGCVEGRTCPV